MKAAARLAGLILGITLSCTGNAGPQDLPRVGIVANTVPLAEWSGKPIADGTPNGGLAIREGLEQRGWVDGKNVQILWRSAEGRFDRLPAIFEELVKGGADVIVAIGPGTAAAAKATATVPIVMAVSAPMLGARVGDSLARPARNLTGLSVETSGLDAKRMSLLKQSLPHASRVVFLEEERGSCGSALPRIRQAAANLQISILPVVVDPQGDLEAAFKESAALRADAVLVCDGVWAYRYGFQRTLNDWARRYRLPMMHTAVGGADNGGLMSFGVDNMVQYRRIPYFVDRILRGARPADLPIEQPTAVEFVINRRVAKALGVKIPDAVLLQADRVVD
jgi:putative ABC transport system substrate-binding protein